MLLHYNYSSLIDELWLIRPFAVSPPRRFAPGLFAPVRGIIQPGSEQARGESSRGRNGKGAKSQIPFDLRSSEWYNRLDVTTCSRIEGTKCKGWLEENILLFWWLWVGATMTTV